MERLVSFLESSFHSAATTFAVKLQEDVLPQLTGHIVQACEERMRCYSRLCMKLCCVMHWRAQLVRAACFLVG